MWTCGLDITGIFFPKKIQIFLCMEQKQDILPRSSIYDILFHVFKLRVLGETFETISRILKYQK